MKVTSWEVFPDELQAALTKLYPSISWRVALYTTDRARAQERISGVVVQARQGGRDVEIHVAASIIAIETLHDLLDDIYEEVAKALTNR